MYLPMYLCILRSQFIEKGFKKTETFEHSVVLLLLFFFFFFVFCTMREILNQNIIVHVLGFVSCKYGYEILSSHVAMSLIFILL